MVILKAELTSKDLEHIKLVISDCDGVLWRGYKAIPGCNDALERLRRSGRRLVFVSNCAFGDLDYVKEGFKKAKLRRLDTETVYSATYLSILYLKHFGFPNSKKKVYVLGEEGLCDALRKENIQVLGGPEDSGKTTRGLTRMEVDPDVAVVLCGGDFSFNYYKLTYAATCITSHGAIFVATNLDRVAPTSSGQRWPCTGAVAAAVTAATGCKTELLGKPGSLALSLILEDMPDIKPHQVLMIGDNPETDIRFAHKNKLVSALVLSGIADSDAADVLKSGATYCIPSIAHLLPDLAD